MRTALACGVVLIVALAPRPVTGIAAQAKAACSLLTTAQVTAALGGAVGVGKQPTKQGCQWSQQGKAGDERLTLDVRLTTVDTYNKFTTDKSTTITPVGGIGDEAYYATQTKDTRPSCASGRARPPSSFTCSAGQSRWLSTRRWNGRSRRRFLQGSESARFLWTSEVRSQKLEVDEVSRRRAT